MAACANMRGQSNVYSVAIYAGGTSYLELCSVSLPYSPYRYKLTQRSWYEDANGLTIIDSGHERARGGVLQRSIDVECGSESFSIRIDPSSKDVEKGSGDLAQFVVQSISKHGGRVATNELPVIQASWFRESRPAQEVLVLKEDRFTELQRFLNQAYGAPDAAIRSSASNGRSLTYSLQQIGVTLNLTANPQVTILSIIEKQKP